MFVLQANSDSSMPVCQAYNISRFIICLTLVDWHFYSLRLLSLTVKSQSLTVFNLDICSSVGTGSAWRCFLAEHQAISLLVYKSKHVAQYLGSNLLSFVSYRSSLMVLKHFSGVFSLFSLLSLQIRKAKLSGSLFRTLT